MSIIIVILSVLCAIEGVSLVSLYLMARQMGKEIKAILSAMKEIGANSVGYIEADGFPI